MIALSLDTTGHACTAALVNEHGVIASRCDDIGRGHDAHLAPMVADMFKEAGFSPADIHRIAVCTGPGSFTGQRVGLSFARGLALPHKIPVLGFSCFDVWAAQNDPERTRNILTVADVRRGQLCWAYYENGQIKHRPKTNDANLAQAAFNSLPKYQRVQDEPISGPILAWLGLDRQPEDYPAAPLYSRAPDAKLPGGKSLPPAKALSET